MKEGKIEREKLRRAMCRKKLNLSEVSAVVSVITAAVFVTPRFSAGRGQFNQRREW